NSIDPRQPFASYGIDSVRAVVLSGELERRIGCRLSPTIAIEYPTVEMLARHIADRNRRVKTRPDTGTIKTGTQGVKPSEPIAIIGLGCRFPGAIDPDSFWQLLCDGTDAITQFPHERRALLPLQDAQVSARWGGFLKDIDHFDARFFGISQNEAEHTDPQ